VKQDTPDPAFDPDSAFDKATSRLLRREALRRAAEELNTTSRPGLESVLERISREVTEEAAEQRSGPTPPPLPPHPSRP
jgi:hypothetical protein